MVNRREFASSGVLGALASAFGLPGAREIKAAESKAAGRPKQVLDIRDMGRTSNGNRLLLFITERNTWTRVGGYARVTYQESSEPLSFADARLLTSRIHEFWASWQKSADMRKQYGSPKECSVHERAEDEGIVVEFHHESAKLPAKT